MIEVRLTNGESFYLPTLKIATTFAAATGAKIIG